MYEIVNLSIVFLSLVHISLQCSGNIFNRIKISTNTLYSGKCDQVILDILAVREHPTPLMTQCLTPVLSSLINAACDFATANSYGKTYTYFFLIFQRLCNLQKCNLARANVCVCFCVCKLRIGIYGDASHLCSTNSTSHSYIHVRVSL